jgi:hypothetical protein
MTTATKVKRQTIQKKHPRKGVLDGVQEGRRLVVKSIVVIVIIVHHPRLVAVVKVVDRRPIRVARILRVAKVAAEDPMEILTVRTQNKTRAAARVAARVVTRQMRRLEVVAEGKTNQTNQRKGKAKQNVEKLKQRRIDHFPLTKHWHKPTLRFRLQLKHGI